VSVPYSEIARIDELVTHHSWGVLAIGLVVTVSGFALELLAPAQLGAFLRTIGLLPALAVSGRWNTVLQVFLPCAPLIAAAAVYLVRVRVGYVIRYGESQKVFLDREFGRALRIADSLTEKDLIKKPKEEPEAG
jgi:hypothetical protein